jgi:glycosidase
LPPIRLLRKPRRIDIPIERFPMTPASTSQRVRIYQFLPRLFTNVNETRKPNGTLEENGVGKFADLNETALAAIKALGCTHVWLTGVLRQATSTDYAAIGLPADDPDLLKGLAGSPYAIKDYFDVCPDYAVQPAERMAEFRALLGRAHAAGLQVIIDFVANHVARSYRSVVQPSEDFGADDDRTKFFDPRNNFFYLQRDSPGDGPPLRLPTVRDGHFVSPTCQVLGHGDGLFDGEREHGRVTGNNVVSWTPSLYDWYETAKLNYGFDFTTGAREYPTEKQAQKPIPDTWQKMDRVLAHWQRMGVDGFRCDMAHMVPVEFWAWLVAQARTRNPTVFFAGEAYDNDPMKVTQGNVMTALLHAGFDAVYDDPSYKVLKGLYDGPKWANDLDAVIGEDFLFQRALRYAENHDEVRLAGAGQWGGVGMDVGRPVAAILYGLSRGPVLLYSGQEVGEPAAGPEGFGGNNARTTIFD